MTVVKNSAIIWLIMTILIFPQAASGYVTTFTPSLSVSREYNDNLNLTEEDRQQDSITTVSPGFDAGILGKYGGMRLAYTPGFSRYDRYSENDTFRHSGDVSAWHDMTRNTRVELADRFIRTEEPVSEGDNTIRRSREYYYRNTASVDLTHRFGLNDVAGIGYTNTILENEDDAVEDNLGHTGRFNLIVMMNNRMGAEAEIRRTLGTFEVSEDIYSTMGRLRLFNRIQRNLYGFIEYAHTDMDYRGGVREDYMVYYPSAGINYSFEEDGAFRLSAGYFIQDRERSDNEEGFLVRSEIMKTWILRRWTVDVMGASGYEESFLDAENPGFEIYYQTDVQVDYGITRNLRFNLNTSFRSDDYINSLPGERDREDIRFSLGSGLALQAKRWLRLRFDYSYTKFDSTINENDYEENRVIFTAAMIWERPSRGEK